MSSVRQLAHPVLLMALAAPSLAVGAQDPALPLLGAKASPVIVVKPVTDEPLLRPARRPDDRPYLCSVSFALAREGARSTLHRAQLVLFTGERETESQRVTGERMAQLTCALDESGRQAFVQLMVSSPGKAELVSRAQIWLPGEDR
jgi:hypothetical protein